MARAQIVTSPRGTAKYPHLTTPDTKFNADGDYKINLVLQPAEGEAFAEKIDEAHKANLEATAKEKKVKKVKEADLPYKLLDDGTYEFRFKLKAKGKTKTGEEFSQKPALYDSKNSKLPADVKVGGGSVVRVACEINPFFTATVGAGVSLRLKGVQVIELRTFGASAESMGFEVEDEGFTAEESEGFPAETAANAEKPADNGGDF